MKIHRSKWLSKQHSSSLMFSPLSNRDVFQIKTEIGPEFLVRTSCNNTDCILRCMSTGWQEGQAEGFRVKVIQGAPKLCSQGCGAISACHSTSGHLRRLAVVHGRPQDAECQRALCSCEHAAVIPFFLLSGGGPKNARKKTKNNLCILNENFKSNLRT